MPAKNGSEKKRAWGSDTTRATESARRVTRLRAARLGTYPSLATARSTWALTSGLTLGELLPARDPVAPAPPARAATCSRVGAAPFPGGLGLSPPGLPLMAPRRGRRGR